MNCLKYKQKAQILNLEDLLRNYMAKLFFVNESS